MAKGVKPGYREIWKYTGRWDERKLRPGLWRFRFRATKRRGSKSYGSFPKGTRGAWRIKGIQNVTKTGMGEYQTDFRGYKKPIYFKTKRKYYG